MIYQTCVFPEPRTRVIWIIRISRIDIRGQCGFHYYTRRFKWSNYLNNADYSYISEHFPSTDIRGEWQWIRWGCKSDYFQQILIYTSDCLFICAVFVLIRATVKLYGRNQRWQYEQWGECPKGDEINHFELNRSTAMPSFREIWPTCSFVFSRIWLRWFQTTSRRRAQKLPLKRQQLIPLKRQPPLTAARAKTPAKPVRAVRVARRDKSKPWTAGIQQKAAKATSISSRGSETTDYTRWTTWWLQMRAKGSFNGEDDGHLWTELLDLNLLENLVMTYLLLPTLA